MRFAYSTFPVYALAVYASPVCLVGCIPASQSLYNYGHTFIAVHHHCFQSLCVVHCGLQPNAYPTCGNTDMAGSAFPCDEAAGWTLNWANANSKAPQGGFTQELCCARRTCLDTDPNAPGNQPWKATGECCKGWTFNTDAAALALISPPNNVSCCLVSGPKSAAQHCVPGSCQAASASDIVRVSNCHILVTAYEDASEGLYMYSAVFMLDVGPPYNLNIP